MLNKDVVKYIIVIVAIIIFESASMYNHPLINGLMFQIKMESIMLIKEDAIVENFAILSFDAKDIRADKRTMANKK